VQGDVHAHLLCRIERPAIILASYCPLACLPASQIWVISRYYGDDVHMSQLLERIAHALQAGAAC
jgi:hypothetical protein